MTFDSLVFVETSTNLNDAALPGILSSNGVGKKLHYRIRAGKHTPSFRMGDRTWVPNSTDPQWSLLNVGGVGVTLPCPFKTDGTPNQTFINGLVALFQAAQAY